MNGKIFKGSTLISIIYLVENSILNSSLTYSLAVYTCIVFKYTTAYSTIHQRSIWLSLIGHSKAKICLCPSLILAFAPMTWLGRSDSVRTVLTRRRSHTYLRSGLLLIFFLREVSQSRMKITASRNSQPIW